MIKVTISSPFLHMLFTEGNPIDMGHIRVTQGIPADAVLEHAHFDLENHLLVLHYAYPGEDEERTIVWEQDRPEYSGEPDAGDTSIPLEQAG